MEIPAEAEHYIKETIERSLGFPISAEALRLMLATSEDHRRRLQDQIFVLQQRLNDADKRINCYKAEASMNAQGIRRCVEEKEMLTAQCTKLERECTLYEQDLERLMESCDELAKENEELQSRLQDQENSSVADTSLVAEVASLQSDRENLRINLNRAEEEVKVLFEENRLLDEENKRLLKQLNKERQYRSSENKQHSASSSAKGKRKTRMRDSSSTEGKIDFCDAECARQPLSPLVQNTPDSRMNKK